MGEEFIEVLFTDDTYTGAKLESEDNARKAFNVLVGYMNDNNGSVVPLNFEIGYGNVAFSKDVMREAVANSRSTLFPGARKMGLPFKEAVETFILRKYFGRIGNGLTKKDIWREDKKLYEALGSYNRLYGKLPFDIPSERDLVQRNLEQFYRQGVATLTPKQRTSVSRKARREVPALATLGR